MVKMLRPLRKQKGLSMKELGQIFGIAESTVSQYETGKRDPDYEMLLKLSEFFSVSVDYLLRGVEAQDTKRGLRIPVLGSIPAGIPLEAIEDVIDWEEIPEEMARGGKEYFALRVSGDSMYPKILDGDTVVIRKQPVCESGDDCVVYVNGDDATLKTVKLHEDGSLTIQPINPNYAPRTFTVEEVQNLPVAIAGVVVELRRKFRS